MDGIGKELIRWLVGGGALALLTFGGTTYYQQVQLALQQQEQQAQQELDRQKFLRDFLSNHVEIATKGSLEERLRFASYFTALGADNLGVNFDNYKDTLIAEAEEVRLAEAAALPPNDAGAGADSGGSSGDGGADAGAGAGGGGGSNSGATSPGDGGSLTGSGGAPATAPDRMQTQAPAYLVTGLSNTVVARRAERDGFQGLLANNFKTAHEQFTLAEQRWPTYHNVSELRRLTGNRLESYPGGELPESAYKDTLKEILKKYSWGMPDDIKASMQRLVKE